MDEHRKTLILYSVGWLPLIISIYMGGTADSFITYLYVFVLFYSMGGWIYLYYNQIMSLRNMFKKLTITTGPMIVIGLVIYLLEVISFSVTVYIMPVAIGGLLSGAMWIVSHNEETKDEEDN
jgi:hypothetical protein